MKIQMESSTYTPDEYQAMIKIVAMWLVNDLPTVVPGHDMILYIRKDAFQQIRCECGYSGPNRRTRNLERVFDGIVHDWTVHHESDEVAIDQFKMELETL